MKYPYLEFTKDKFRYFRSSLQKPVFPEKTGFLVYEKLTIYSKGRNIMYMYRPFKIRAYASLLLTFVLLILARLQRSHHSETIPQRLSLRQ